MYAPFELLLIRINKKKTRVVSILGMIMKFFEIHNEELTT